MIVNGHELNPHQYIINSLEEVRGPIDNFACCNPDQAEVLKEALKAMKKVQKILRKAA